MADRSRIRGPLLKAAPQSAKGRGKQLKVAPQSKIWPYSNRPDVAQQHVHVVKTYTSYKLIMIQRRKKLRSRCGRAVGFHLLHGPCLPPLWLPPRLGLPSPQHPSSKSGETGSCCQHGTGSDFLPCLIHDPTTAVVCGRDREQASVRPRLISTRRRSISSS